MNFSIERPWALWGLIFVIPAALFLVRFYYKTGNALVELYKRRNPLNPAKQINRVKFRYILRCILRLAAWVSAVLAFAGISWGTVSMPVQRHGSAVSFVFDISYSMTARDAPSGLTRLEAAGEYARMLMTHLPDSEISTVIAKGDGVIAIPLTEDYEAVYSFISMLSPDLMTSPGTSLGKGIEAALRSFPRTMSQAAVIWLFTDGDETDTALLPALNTALRAGISVVIIGFGSERGTEITAGDGHTVVKTSLRSDKIRDAVDAANKKNQGTKGIKFFKGAYARYVDATEVGSAINVLSSVKSVQESDSNFVISYEMQTVKRHSLFIGIAIFLFILSFIISEFSPAHMKEVLGFSLVVAGALSFTSCSASFSDSKKILEATWNWHQKKYNEAVSDFMQVLDSATEAGDQNTVQYALYGLSATYLMQNEKDASLSRMMEISDDASDSIKFNVYYNSGIIAQRDGNYTAAVECFKNALLINPSDVNAKINLELSTHNEVQRAREGEQEMISASESPADFASAEQTVFNRIRENDENHWKGTKTEQRGSSVLDY